MRLLSHKAFFSVVIYKVGYYLLHCKRALVMRNNTSLSELSDIYKTCYEYLSVVFYGRVALATKSS